MGKDRISKKDIKIFIYILLLVLGILFLRLFYMQLVMGEKYENMAERNKMRMIPLVPARGDIYDRNMNVLATNKNVFALSVALNEVSEKEILVENLAQLLADQSISHEALQDKLDNYYRPYEPVEIIRLEYTEGIKIVSIVAEHQEDYPGVIIQEVPMRDYPLGSVAGHVLGTVGLINQSEYSQLKDSGYLINDWIGKTGIEKYYENFVLHNKTYSLRGTYGVDQIEVNARHIPVSSWSHQDPVQGNSLVMTIDIELQRLMQEKMAKVVADIQKNNDKAGGGAAVLMDVKTGAVLAMASYPNIDPNDFSKGLTQEQVDYYWDNKTKPTFNRAISGAYPPGSVFKMVTGVAALDKELIDPLNDYINCVPANWLSTMAKCWSVHGKTNYYKAVAESCNTYFQTIGTMVGPDDLYQTARDLGLGNKTGIDLGGEVSGILPNPEWKALNFSGWEKNWHSYDTNFMAMGQGYNLFTPIQLANYISVIANGGTRYQPYLVKSILSAEGEIVEEIQPKVLDEGMLSQFSLAETRKAMLQTTQIGGTAYYIFQDFPEDIQVACKTGTAQTGLVGDDKNKDYHGVFVAFAPYDDPEIAFAGIIEYGYHGGSSAGVVAKSLFAEYFGIENARESGFYTVE